ncbi:hypothetical protein CSKR_112855 [Clonorchis sinensis]|uniref:Uncharacterized protein n=1 Tax=Clonorchis sinensis TaxID=79923 RepID=A0A3R7GPR2_CLOSI|nr:hypothetical protein CSKR_112855 [Clonorchis sinensis]
MYSLYNRHQSWDTQTYINYLFAVQQHLLSNVKRRARQQTFRSVPANQIRLEVSGVRSSQPTPNTGCETFVEHHAVSCQRSETESRQPSVTRSIGRTEQTKQTITKRNARNRFRESSNSFDRHDGNPHGREYSETASLAHSGMQKYKLPKYRMYFSPSCDRSTSSSGNSDNRYHAASTTAHHHQIRKAHLMAAVERVSRYRERMHHYATYGGPIQYAVISGRTKHLTKMRPRFPIFDH